MPTSWSLATCGCAAPRVVESFIPANNPCFLTPLLSKSDAGGKVCSLVPKSGEYGRPLVFPKLTLENALASVRRLCALGNNAGVQSKTVDDVFRLIEFDPDNLRLLIRIRQASRANEIESKMAPEDYIARGELQAAIGDGLERANLVLSQAVSDAIFNAISDHKALRMKRLINESRVSA